MIYVKSNSNSFSSVAFTRHDGSLITMGNHDVMSHPGKVDNESIGIKHYQYRSFDQFAKKMKNGKRVYDQTSMSPAIGSHWRKMGAWSDQQLSEWWENYISQPVKLYDGI